VTPPGLIFHNAYTVRLQTKLALNCRGNRLGESKKVKKVKKEKT